MLRHWLCVSSCRFQYFLNVLSSTSLIWSYHYYHHYSHACLFVVHWFWSTFLWCFLASLQYLVYCLNLVYYLMPSGWFIWGRRRAHGMQLCFACILNVEAKERKQRWLIFILSTQYVLIWICILQQSSQASWHHYYILTALLIGYPVQEWWRSRSEAACMFTGRG